MCLEPWAGDTEDARNKRRWICEQADIARSFLGQIGHPSCGNLQINDLSIAAFFLDKEKVRELVIKLNNVAFL